MGGGRNKLSDENVLKEMNEASIYTIEQLQASKQAAVHWDNLTNVPPEFDGENKFTSLDDTPVGITANYKLVGNPGGTALIFIEDTQDGADGADGKEVELQKTATYIQWRYVGESWVNLVALTDITGAQGDKGDTGDTGVTGDTGAAGTNGTNGNDGAQGDQGIQGDQGLQGDQGDQGIQGDVGAAGADGSNGTNGTNGVDGLSISIVSGTPTGGNDNDSAIDIITWNLWEKIPVSGWAIQGNIKGATGNNGADGSDGADGNIYLTTSTTAIDLGVENVGDTVAITVAASNLSYSAGQLLVISSSTSLYFVGRVLSYAGTSLSVSVVFKIGITSSSSWTLNLAGVVEADALPDWYTITATAGSGTVASRVFTGPSGWTIDSSDNVVVAGLGSNAADLIIKHDTGLYAVDCVVFTDDGSKYTKVQIPVSYATMYEDLTHIALELASFCTIQQALIIHVKLQ
jgi:hypothetical protein